MFELTMVYARGNSNTKENMSSILKSTMYAGRIPLLVSRTVAPARV